MKKQTKAIRTQTPKTKYREHSTPLFLTSSFTFESAEQGKALFEETEDGNIYSRFSNPTVQEFVDKVCLLEDCEDGVATATGMAAVFASMAALLKTGDHIIASRALFGSAHQVITQILSKWGITHTYLDADASEADWEAAVQPNSKMVYLETPSNPGLDLVDLAMVGRLCKKHNLIFNVDNCFASPALQNPAEYGADLIVHSATKYMDGQGRVLGGVVVGKKEYIKELRFFCRQTGPSMSPFNAWVLTKSLETLGLRMDRHCSNALALAEALEKHPDVKSVRYPFLESHPQHELAKQQMSAGGAIVTIDLEGGFERVSAFMDALEIASLSSNLGDTRTIVTNPNTTTHAKLKPEEKKALGITEGLIRISVGLEDIEDLIEDFTNAVEVSVKSDILD
ncbi:aminotransferase class I/II-fold pyridoxal phosphate-dependent enzyme [Dyadobacter chenwenxiniae]|uniref:O-succinylhomoserine sulfhydrylase n=1 Tax=Dyadobacter chenwenxiniae TaxID=2906456 RepID=A0A9X1PN93_9BACT|nr:aminotransferase class I/II-fold pyridoxal phosphate-dependent enzyme [Dyadobacter chenwenxiniae]MCF0063545.1 aminotransferase class I/II-fold pyridoxal phosphate-dependent enzyme [Dyadobacter chenwenxiniae]UON83223.1 aminotransferase class I/II-fold pyridoxal phosphate-dependent enzyme [Dyadobacter chenwenxiniae]